MLFRDLIQDRQTDAIDLLGGRDKLSDCSFRLFVGLSRQYLFD
jgi:hypothetical protein